MAVLVREIIRVFFIWIVAEVFFCEKAETLEYKNFRCRNGKYISNTFFCDNDLKDCDGSDESFGCARNCGQRNFECVSDGVCIDVAGRCNAIANCADKSDEYSCNGENDITNCSLDNGKFLCHDELKCLDYNNTCNGICNCYDCSDENVYNCSKFDTDSCRSCMRNNQFCLPTPNGPQCACNLSSNYKSNEFCREVLDCTRLGHCEQHCSSYNGTTHCLCFEGFHEVPGSRQKNVQPKCRSDGSSITSLSVDWITQNIYFTSNGSLSVCTNDGKLCAELECCEVDNIVLAPTIGQMYYSEKSSFQNERIIMRSNMDGSEKNFLLDSSFPNFLSLAIDEEMETLYWYERSKNILYSRSLHGPDVEANMQFQIETYPLGGSDQYSPSFTSLDGILYFSDYQHGNKIYSSLKKNINIITGFHTDLQTNAIIYLHASNPHLLRRKKNNTENPCKSATCDGLCLLRSNLLTRRLNYTCICQNHSSTNHTNYWCNTYSAHPTEDPKLYPGTESLSANQQTSTVKAENGMAISPFYANDATDRFPASTTSSSAAPLQNSKSDVALGFMSGVALVLGVIVLYFIFEKVYLNRHHRAVDITELMDVQ